MKCTQCPSCKCQHFKRVDSVLNMYACEGCGEVLADFRPPAEPASTSYQGLAGRALLATTLEEMLVSAGPVAVVSALAGLCGERAEALKATDGVGERLAVHFELCGDALETAKDRARALEREAEVSGRLLMI
jgi:hypothetical protein